MIDIDLIKRAIAEDLEGGVDVTSTSTISVVSVSTADFTSRKSGVLA